MFILEAIPGDIENKVLRKEIDLGITYAPVSMEGLEFYKIGSFKFEVFSRKGIFNSISFSEIPFAVPISKVSESFTEVKTLDHWPSNISRTVEFQFELLETTLETTRQGLSVLHCPEFVIRLQNEYLKEEFQLIPLTMNIELIRPKLDIYLITRKGFPEDDLVKKVSKSIRKYCL